MLDVLVEKVGRGGSNSAHLPVREAVESQMCRVEGGGWECLVCRYNSKYSTHVRRHVESQHMEGLDLTCEYCGGKAPAELAFGSPMTLPSQLLPAVDANPAAVESSFPVAHRTEPLRPLSYAEVAGRIPGNLATASQSQEL